MYQTEFAMENNAYESLDTETKPTHAGKMTAEAKLDNNVYEAIVPVAKTESGFKCGIFRRVLVVGAAVIIVILLAATIALAVLYVQQSAEIDRIQKGTESGPTSSATTQPGTAPDNPGTWTPTEPTTLAPNSSLTSKEIPSGASMTSSFAPSTQTPDSVTEQVVCPPANDATVLQFSNRCYYLPLDSTRRNFFESNQFCQNRTTPFHLVDILNEEEQKWIESVAVQRKDICTCGVRVGDTEQFVWTSGAAMVYENWAEGEPNDGGNIEDCLELYHFHDWMWNDTPCEIVKDCIPICEYP